jgi:hypothetical protein
MDSAPVELQRCVRTEAACGQRTANAGDCDVDLERADGKVSA